jgi:hypothetical protein
MVENRSLMRVGIFLLGIVGVLSIPATPTSTSFVQVQDDPLTNLKSLTASLNADAAPTVSLLASSSATQPTSLSLSAPAETGAISLPSTSASTLAATSPTATAGSSSLSDLFGTGAETPKTADSSLSDGADAALALAPLTHDADSLLAATPTEGLETLHKNESLESTVADVSPEVGNIINTTVAAAVASNTTLGEQVVSNGNVLEPAEQQQQQQQADAPVLSSGFDDIMKKYLPADSSAADAVSSLLHNTSATGVLSNGSVSEEQVAAVSNSSVAGEQVTVVSNGSALDEQTISNGTVAEVHEEQQQQQQGTLFPTSANSSLFDSIFAASLNTTSPNSSLLDALTSGVKTSDTVIANTSNTTEIEATEVANATNVSNATEVKVVDHPDEIIGPAVDDNATDADIVPIFIIFRDRVDHLKKTIASIKNAIESPYQIVIHNLESTYPPAVEYLNTLKAEGIPVYHQSLNTQEARQLLNGTLELNADGVSEKLTDQSILLVRRTIAQYRQERGDFKYYVVTDAGTALAENTPLDILWYYQHILETMPHVAGVAPGLKTDDIPDANPDKEAILAFEANNTSVEVAGVEWEEKPVTVHVAPIDT